MFERHRVFEGLVRAAALAALIFSVRTVYADIPAYQSRFFQDSGDLLSALDFSERAYARGKREPDYLFRRAALLAKAAEMEGTGVLYQNAADAYQDLADKLPVPGKAGLLAAHYKSRWLELNNEMTRETWAAVEKQIFEAQASQPGSLWLAYHAGVEIFRQSRFTDNSARVKALELIRRATAGEPDKYLRPALEFSFRWGFSKEAWISLIPVNAEAYKDAADFFSEEGLWGPWASVYTRLLGLRSIAYERYCEEGDLKLAEGDILAALNEFKRAAGIDSVSGRAQIGQALCLFYTERRDFKSSEAVLERMLEEDNLLGEVGRQLTGPTAPSLGAYSKGVLFMRAGRYEEALKFLEKETENKKYGNYFRAEALVRLGRRNEAAAFLEKHMRGGEVSVRELLLLETLEPGMKEQTQKLLNEQVTKSRPARAWWDSDSEHRFLSEGEKSGLLLTLMPGRTQIHVAVRLDQGGRDSGAGLLFRLGGVPAAAKSVSGDRWGLASFVVEASGGRYWLSCERLSALKPEGHSARVQLGDVRLINERGGGGGSGE